LNPDLQEQVVSDKFLLLLLGECFLEFLLLFFFFVSLFISKSLSFGLCEEFFPRVFSSSAAAAAAAAEE
jgi:hypothetical protein